MRGWTSRIKLRLQMGGRVAATALKTGGLPLRPRLVLRAGVTGHRLDKLTDADPAVIEAAISACLSSLAEGARALWRAEAAMPFPAFSAEPPLLRVVSALAEGTDRFAARAALALDSKTCAVELECPLPFARKLYRQDFATAESRAEFDRLLGQARSVLELAEPPQAGTAQNYLAAGVAMLQHSDVLLAVWNGKEPRGIGGTGDIVQRAADAGIPVIWIKPWPPMAVSLIWPRHEPYRMGEASVERLVEGAVLISAPEIAALAARVIGTPAPARPQADPRRHGAAGKPAPRAALEDFLGSATPELDAASAAHFTAFESLLTPGGQRFASRMRAIVLPRYVSADWLGSFWARLHRRGYALNFLLAATAVFFALISVPVHDWKVYATIAEVLTILAIVIHTQIGKRQRWHSRWIETRLLAEQLRNLMFLAFTGAGGSQLRSRGREAASQADQASSAWTSFYAAASQRELGLPSLVVDRAYVTSAAHALRQGVIQDQIAYHRHRAERFPHHEHRLHLIGAACLGGAALVSMSFLAIRWLSCAQDAGGLGAACFFSMEHFPDKAKHAVEWVPFLAGVLPAFGAAAYGVRLQSDFEGTQSRSAAMLAALQEIDRAMAREAGSMTFARLGEFAEYTAQIMSGDLASWRVVFEGRPLALPG